VGFFGGVWGRGGACSAHPSRYHLLPILLSFSSSAVENIEVFG